MAQIQAPYTFVTGDQVTAANLNAHTNSAILLPGSITDQPDIAANTVAAGDSIALHDLSALTLKEATVGDLLNSGIGITTGAIAGSAGGNIVITPAATYALSIAGNLSSTGNLSVTGTSTLTGDVAANGTLTVTGNASFNSVEALKLPAGTTIQRPSSPVAGQLRYNSTLAAPEVYNGTSWDSVFVGGTTLEISGTVNITGAIQYNGTPVYGLYEVFVQNFQSSGSSTITSSTFSKPSDEIWVFELDYSPVYNSGDYTTVLKAGGSSWWYTRFNAITKPTAITAKWVVQAGTTLTSETVTFTSLVGGGSPPELNRELRIHKYRTA